MPRTNRYKLNFRAGSIVKKKRKRETQMKLILASLHYRKLRYSNTGNNTTISLTCNGACNYRIVVCAQNPLSREIRLKTRCVPVTVQDYRTGCKSNSRGGMHACMLGPRVHLCWSVYTTATILKWITRINICQFLPVGKWFFHVSIVRL